MRRNRAVAVLLLTVLVAPGCADPATSPSVGASASAPGGSASPPSDRQVCAELSRAYSIFSVRITALAASAPPVGDDAAMESIRRSIADWVATVRRLAAQVSDPALATALTEYGTALEDGSRASNIPGDIAALFYGEPGLEQEFREIEKRCQG